jgi:hypothetical protein
MRVSGPTEHAAAISAKIAAGISTSPLAPGRLLVGFQYTDLVSIVYREP